ncbi:MAG: hypothetical protein K5765_03010 [Clostridia bacterium]|nr:hypothetical protein [Clostridia bacterium]
MNNDNFTYEFYEKMVIEILKSGYIVKKYFDAETTDKQCILRHDIDFDIYKSLLLAKLEAKLGVTSTYFVLLKTDFYNPMSKKSIDMLKEIIALGHDIGLHFDEKSYGDDKDIVEKIKNEVNILSRILDYDVKVVSMHRPSKKTLESNYVIDGLINSYSSHYFNEYKYVSDSRRRWREDVNEIIASGKYKNIHILTHAFWYNDTSVDITSSLKSFVNDGILVRYNSLKENFTDLNEVLKMEVRQ